jgi:hypothetical protein
MKILQIVTAFIEAGAGLIMLVWPSELIEILFGVAVDTPIGLIVGRWTGVALLAFGVACWIARNDDKSPASSGLFAAMLSYNIGLVTLLAYGSVVSGLVGLGFWPAVVVHSAMAVACVACRRGVRVSASGGS